MTEQQIQLPQQVIFVDYQPSGVRDTSIDAFNKIVDSLPLSRLLVFRAIQSIGGKATNSQLRRVLGWEINRITPRVQELRKLGILRYSGKHLDNETKKEVCQWEIAR